VKTGLPAALQDPRSLTGPHRPLPAREPTIAVLGHEREGIPPEALELAHGAVEIPMVGTGASLNVAVAGSLVLYKLAGLL
jgi:tRNA (guanosine-2'-O-)-methyltransferase